MRSVRYWGRQILHGLVVYGWSHVAQCTLHELQAAGDWALGLNGPAAAHPDLAHVRPLTPAEFAAWQRLVGEPTTDATAEAA